MSHMEMIFLDGNNACKTGVSAEFESPQHTWEAFKSAKQIAVPSEQATFAIDYYNLKGDLNHTVHIDDAGFQYITGNPPESAEFYRAHELCTGPVSVHRCQHSAPPRQRKGGE